MKSTSKKKEIPTNFPDIQTAEQLKIYLDDSTNRLKNSRFLYHYTTVSNAIKILRSKTWHLGNASGMNDRLEYKSGRSLDPTRWNNLFFSSFTCEDKENIGMWSMYSQPWEKGVKITLPRKTVINWIKETKNLLVISPRDLQRTREEIIGDGHNVSLRLSAVAYSNADSLQGSEQEKITWSNTKNYNIRHPMLLPELIGYIKNIAWSYEKEVRIKAEFNTNSGIQRVAIPLTDKVIRKMTITAGPLFVGSLKDVLLEEAIYEINTEQSIFTGQLNIENPCLKCELKLRQST